MIEYFYSFISFIAYKQKSKNYNHEINFFKDKPNVKKSERIRS